MITLGSISHGDRGDFVPHLSITIALALLLAALGVLIYFIHHIATSIQLPQVIAGLAGDLSAAIDAEIASNGGVGTAEAGPSVTGSRSAYARRGPPSPRPPAATSSSSTTPTSSTSSPDQVA